MKRRNITKTFKNKSEFDKWALSLSEESLENVFRVKIDNNSDEIMGLAIYDLEVEPFVLLSPLTVEGPLSPDGNGYVVYYPHISIDWNKLTVKEELTEKEALISITGNAEARIYYPLEQQRHLPFLNIGRIYNLFRVFYVVFILGLLFGIGKLMKLF